MMGRSVIKGLSMPTSMTLPVKLKTLKYFRSSHKDAFLRKGVLKIRSKFTGEQPCEVQFQ